MKRRASTPLTSTFVALDIETTGLSYKRGDRIIELAAVAVKSGETVAEFQSLMNSEKRISSSAFRVHGITRQEVAGAPGAEDVIPAIKAFIGGRPLVAHNAGFDTGFLRYEYARLGLRLTNKFFCTLRLSKRLLPSLPDYRLATVYRNLFAELPEETNLHRALDDARLVAGLWRELIKIQASRDSRKFSKTT